MSTQTLSPLQMATDALTALAAAEALRVEALRALESVAGDLIHELSELQAAYGQDRDDELCTDVILAEVRLDLIGDLVDALER